MGDSNIPMAKTKKISEKEIKENIPFNPESLENEEQGQTSSTIAIIFFILITTLFTIVIYFTLPNIIPSDNTNTNTIYFVIYILTLVIGNYFINLNITKTVCGGQPQWASTMINTIIPWILIFGVMNIVLIIFPGWVSPFANTFGYGAMNLLGLKDLLKVILNLDKDNPDSKLSDSQKLVARGIQEIYGNSSLFINQVPVASSKFKEFVNTLITTGYFRKGITIDSQEIVSLYKLLRLKELVGKYIWNILSGILVTSISYNFIINVSCSNSLKEMKEKRNDFLVTEKKRQNTKDNGRLYYPFLVGENNNNTDIDVKSSSFSTTHN